MTKEKIDKFVTTYLNSKTITETAKKLDISRYSIYKYYLSSPEVKRALRDKQEELLHEVKKQMEQNLIVATKELMEIIVNPKTRQSVKVQAINSLFTNYEKLSEKIDIQSEIEGLREEVIEIQEGNTKTA